jgi:hypothetical protein
MHRSLLLVLALAPACTRPLASLDDEAGETTNMGGESTDEESTDEESTTSTETSSSEEGLTFIPQGDIIEANQCEPFAQDCPHGEKCVPMVYEGIFLDHKCVPVLGDQQPNEPCKLDDFIDATDDCDATSFCWPVQDVEGELIGECKPFCMGTQDAPECPGEDFCLASDFNFLVVCVPDCDPLLQDCGAGQGCFWADFGFTCVFNGGEIPTGEPCGFINDCAPGNACADMALLPDCMGSRCCTEFCDLELADVQCSDPATVCMPFFEEGQAPAADEDVGFCILPP